jgi:RND family efflux transporter MFP subunit
MLTTVCVFAPAINLVACRVQRAEARMLPVQARMPIGAAPIVPVVRRAVVTATGMIAPRASIDLSFQVAGIVMAIGVEEGEKVAAGELVALLDPTEYALAFEQAKLEYLGAAGEAKKARVMRTSDATGTPNEYDQVIAAEAFTKIVAARAEKRLYDTQLASPMAGVVARRSVKPGEIVTSGTTAFTIVDLDVVHVRVGVSEADISSIARGADAIVTVPALDSARYSGKVRLVGVAADPATGKIEVENPEHRLKPGMSARAEINTAGTSSSKATPASRVALRRGNGERYVYEPIIITGVAPGA